MLKCESVIFAVRRSHIYIQIPGLNTRVPFNIYSASLVRYLLEDRAGLLLCHRRVSSLSLVVVIFDRYRIYRLQFPIEDAFCLRTMLPRYINTYIVQYVWVTKREGRNLPLHTTRGGGPRDSKRLPQFNFSRSASGKHRAPARITWVFSPSRLDF